MWPSAGMNYCSGPTEERGGAEESWKSSLHSACHKALTFDGGLLCGRATNGRMSYFALGPKRGKSLLQICYIDTGEHVLNSSE